MEIEFSVMLWITPNKWYDLLVVMPPRCRTVETYENLKSFLLGEKFCATNLTIR